MRFLLTFFVMSTLCSNLLQSQTCLPNGVSLSSQQAIDDFPLNYPNCSVIEGSLNINNGTTITNLSGLSGIDTIYGDLEIQFLPNLSTLTGLEALKHVDGQVLIRNNDALVNLVGLSGLNTIGRSLQINSNPNLTLLQGLENLTAINTTLAANQVLRVSGNSSLNNLDGLLSLVSLDSKIDILNNIILSSITGISSIDEQTIPLPTNPLPSIRISGNTNLSSCSILSICNSAYVEGLTYFISNNQSGCMNPSELATACNFPIDTCGQSGTILIETFSDHFYFPLDYPGCTVVANELRIGNQLNTLNILQGLEQIEHVQGRLRITNCNSLVDFSGLSNLKTIGEDFVLLNNDAMTNLIGLTSLDSINGDFEISNCDNFFDFIGLNSIDYIGSLKLLQTINSYDGLESLNKIGDELFITSANSLEGLSGLETLEGSLNILNNSNITYASGLNNLNALIGSINISGNSSLEEINILNSLTYLPGQFAVENNPNLETILGFSNLITLNGNSRIENNPSLDSIGGFEGLTTANNNIEVRDNSALIELNAFPSLVNAPLGVAIINNNALTSIENFGGTFAGTTWFMSISSNPNLSSCSSPFVCDHLANGGSGNIFNNTVGCNSSIEVESLCSALPIEWTSNLKAVDQKSSIVLNWSVSNQINNEYFQIEKSSDGIQFKPIGRIIGEINFSPERQYSFVDEQPYLGKNYYRIKQVDFSSDYSFSNIAVANFSDSGTALDIYPNPAHSKIYIRGGRVEAVRIYNTMGEVIYNSTTFNESGEIDINFLSNGIYFISLDGQIKQKFIVQR